MKHGVKLKKNEKVFLSEKGYDPNEWLLERNLVDKYIFVKKGTEELLELEK